METKKLYITPHTKIAELLDAYPQLEEELIKISPHFKKLKNPVLRKTIAKIANLQQAAVMGNVPLQEMIGKLRKAAGQDEIFSDVTGGENLHEIPGWFDENKITARFDAVPKINAGGHPMGEIISRAGETQKGEIFELTTPFIPAPIIDMIVKKGFEVFSKSISADVVKTYFYKLP